MHPMHDMKEVEVTSMTDGDLDTLYAWTLEEDWNVTFQDLKVMYDADPSAFFVARKNLKMIGVINGACHEDKFGCVGNVLVDKECRGKGIARILLQTVNEHLKVKEGIRNSCLSSKLNMVSAYGRHGYCVRSWDVVIYNSPTPFPHRLLLPPTPGLTVLPVDKADWEDLVNYDTRFNLTNRVSLLRNLVTKQGSATLVAILDSDVVGYGTIQPATRGHRVAPLYAETPSIGRRLLSSLIEAVGGATCGELTVDAISANMAFVKMAAELGLTEHYRLPRLYTLREIPFETEKIFSLANTDVSII